MPFGRNISVAVTFLAACAPAPQPEAAAPRQAQTESFGFYSASQAARGRGVFRSICAECHDTFEFRGAEFEFAWRRQTVWDLYETMVETMPEDAPGSLPPETYADVIAYVLQLNGYPDGPTDLAPSEQPMDSIPLGPDVDKTGRSMSANR